MSYQQGSQRTSVQSLFSSTSLRVTGAAHSHAVLLHLHYDTVVGNELQLHWLLVLGVLSDCLAASVSCPVGSIFKDVTTFWDLGNYFAEYSVNRADGQSHTSEKSTCQGLGKIGGPTGETSSPEWAIVVWTVQRQDLKAWHNKSAARGRWWLLQLCLCLWR